MPVAVMMALVAGCKTPPDGVAPDRGSPDLRAAPDLAPDGAGLTPHGCEMACALKGAHLCVSAGSQGACVECTSDLHCQRNPRALGPSCKTGSFGCACSNDADCAGRASGGACVRSLLNSVCGCRGDSDCAAGLRCVGTYLGARVCSRPCTADADCTDPLASRCDRVSGQCQACAGDAHCGEHHDGAVCIQGTCRCRGDSDCSGTRVSGARCLKPAADLATGRCRCAADADCRGNANGTRCHPSSGQCSCASDAECAGALARCGPAHRGATSSQCRAGCGSDAQCTAGLLCHAVAGKCSECSSDAHCSAGRPYCSAALGRCAACRTASDCQSPLLPSCDAATGRCVACRADADCAASMDGAACVDGTCRCQSDRDCGGSSAWGPTCRRVAAGASHGVCRCGTATDCTGSPNGARCHAALGKCSCGSDADCPAARPACSPPSRGAGYNHCQPPCTGDASCGSGLTCDGTSKKCIECVQNADCTSPARPFCDSGLGRCVACVTHGQCGLDVPLCDPQTRACTGCMTNAHCSGNLAGAHCDTARSRCICRTAADCQGTGAWGASCLFAAGAGTGVCGCNGAQDCGASPHGPTCDSRSRRCSCQTDANCTRDPALSRCYPSFAGAPFSRCQRPCTTNADCISSVTGFQICEAATGRCAQCLTDGDCTRDPWLRACGSQRTCVECRTNSNCTSSSLGNTCKSELCGCQADADCATNQHGRRCERSFSTCSCLTTADCPAGRACTAITPFGTRICK